MAQQKWVRVMTHLSCVKCQHKWVPRTVNDPKECPSCKNRNWKGVQN